MDLKDAALLAASLTSRTKDEPMQLHDTGPRGRSTRAPKALQRMAVRVCALLAAAVIAAPAAIAQSGGDSVPVVVWTASGNDAATGAARLITVTPASSHIAVAAQLKARPAGSRGLLLSGFANDIATTEIIRRKAAGATVPVPSPWTEKGAANARMRVALFMNGIKRQGAQVDFVVVRCSASLDASQYDQYGVPGWRALQADKRAAALRTAIGSTNLVTDMPASAEIRAAWNDYFSARLDQSLSSAVSATIRKFFPGARVVAEGRYSLPASSAANDARAGGQFGTNDQPQFYLTGSELEPFAALGALVGDARAMASATGRPVVAAIPTPTWGGGTAGVPALRNSAYWSELVYHLLLVGSPSILMDRGTPGEEELSLLGSVITDVDDHAGGTAIAPFASSAQIDGDAVVASAIQVGSTVHWRLSPAPGVEALRIVFSDASTAEVPIDPESGGVWFDHPVAQEVAMIQSTEAVPPESPPEHMVLFDVEPAVGFSQPVEHAQKYLIVYQGAGDPNAQATGIVNPASVVTEVARQVNAGFAGEYGVLDFEDPFDDIVTTGPSHPSYAATMQSLIDTIQAVKAAYPDIKWTYYGWPRIGYYPHTRDWGQWTQPQREVYYAEYVAPFEPLMQEMQWFMPAVYDKYERAANLPNSYSLPFVAEAEFRKANVMAIRRHFENLSLPIPEIMPAVSPWFQEASVAVYLMPVPFDEFCEEQVQPCIEAGADGVSIWGSMDHFIELATWPALPPGYEAQTDMVRARFSLDYFGGMAVGMIDWFSPQVLTTVGDAINDTLEQALEAAAAGGVVGP